MRVISGTTVDIIEPFPEGQYSRLWRWTKMTKMITALDGNTSPFCRSFGVIDKNNELGLRHEAPIIGFIMFEPMPPCSLYAHIASSRRAWGTGLMEEAAKLAIDEVFKTEPGALRVSAAIPAFNKRAIEFAKKVGMHKNQSISCILV